MHIAWVSIRSRRRCPEPCASPDSKGAPVRSVVSFEDYGTALHTAFGVMVALYHRAKTGEGQIVDGSLLATSITYMQAFLAERSVTGIPREQRGNTGFYSSPADVYQASDGWIMVQTVGGDMFARWARLVGREELIGDPRFATDIFRADHREIDYGGDECVARREDRGGSDRRAGSRAHSRWPGAGCPGGAHRSSSEGPRIARIRRLSQALRSPCPLAAPAMQLSATPARIRHRAPMLGEHTSEVLGELGYSDEEIDRLRTAQAV